MCVERICNLSPLVFTQLQLMHLPDFAWESWPVSVVRASHIWMCLLAWIWGYVTAPKSQICETPISHSCWKCYTRQQRVYNFLFLGWVCRDLLFSSIWHSLTLVCFLFFNSIFWNRVFDSCTACVSILGVCLVVTQTSCIILKIGFLFCRHSLLGRHTIFSCCHCALSVSINRSANVFTHQATTDSNYSSNLKANRHDCKAVCSLGGFIWYDNKIGCRLFNISLNEKFVPL